MYGTTHILKRVHIERDQLKEYEGHKVRIQRAKSSLNKFITDKKN